MSIIEVKNLGKEYVIGERQRYLALRDTLTQIGKHPWRWLKDKLSPGGRGQGFWALRDVNFSMEQGEVLGVIGRNGAGKSTLLKILSRITPPTTGEVRLRGRLGSLLEVGTGFHPELTGRENIYLNGVILGMSKSEIERKFDEIVEFSGVEKFLETPVKRYSSGMYVRLAFSVAAHLEPEILLVDEVLAVGDAEFQKKCLGKMEEVTKKDGRTIIFVSHNMGAVANLCQRTIWLDNGAVKMDGSSREVIYHYLSEKQKSSGLIEWSDPLRAPGDNEIVRFRSVKITDTSGSPTSLLYTEEPFHVEFEYEILQAVKGAQLGFKVDAQDGETIFFSGDHNFVTQTADTREPGVYRSRCSIPSNLLNQGHYHLSLLGHIPGAKILVNKENILDFDVEQKTNISGPGIQPGLLRPVFDWSIEKV